MGVRARPDDRQSMLMSKLGSKRVMGSGCLHHFEDRGPEG